MLHLLHQTFGSIRNTAKIPALPLESNDSPGRERYFTDIVQTTVRDRRHGDAGSVPESTKAAFQSSSKVLLDVVCRGWRKSLRLAIWKETGRHVGGSDRPIQRLYVNSVMNRSSSVTPWANKHLSYIIHV